VLSIEMTKTAALLENMKRRNSRLPKSEVLELPM
jgi:hypothetical protein